MEHQEEIEVTPESLAALAKIATRMCDMVIICAPTFAAGSYGAKTVEMAHAMRPRLVGMIAACERKAQKPDATPPAKPDTPADTTRKEQP